MALLTALMWLGHLGDMISTHRALQAGCTELNPLYPLIGFWGLVAVKVVGIGWITRIAWRQWWTFPLWMGIVFGWGLAAWNTFALQYCGTGF